MARKQHDHYLSLADYAPTRRDVLRLGALGLSLPGMFALQAQARAAGVPGGNAALKQPSPRGSNQLGFGKAKSCIVLFAWGGMSHIDTFDLKPDAGSGVKSAFGSIPTKLAGYHVCEHLPRLAQQVHRMSIIRSVCHNAPSHRSAAYWNLTGHEPPRIDANWPASRADWPSLGSMVMAAKGRSQKAQGGRGEESDANSTAALPGTVCLPYTMADGGRANGQDGGFLGLGYDPVVVRPRHGKLYDGVSPSSGSIDLDFTQGIDFNRFVSRRGLLDSLEYRGGGLAGGRSGGLAGDETAQVRQYRTQAMDMLLDPKVRAAFNVDTETKETHAAYGGHICGQSTLMARKLAEAGVPLVTVYCAAGDLNGSAGAHWDTHGDGYNRLKNQMLPPLDQAMSALLDDLHQRGTIDETLVVLLTEFGRTPKVDGSGGRDHYPNCYTVAFAGAGISQGLLYGRSDNMGAFPAADSVSPADLHATIFHSLGIDPHFTLHDRDDRPLKATDGRVLPVYG